MAGKFRLKLGPVEIEYEGDEMIPKADLLELVTAAAALYRERGLGRSADPDDDELTPRLQIHGTTASIASRLNCISAPELIMAAAARLTFVDGQEWFEPVELLEEMKKASAHYDRAYEAKLAGDVRDLVELGKLEEVTTGLYALTATMRRELQRALAE